MTVDRSGPGESPFTTPPWDGWAGSSMDPNDEQFGDRVTPTSLDGAGDHDVVLVGEPYDGAVIGRRGAREGPLAIRRALASLETHHFGVGPVTDRLSVADLGDVRATHGTGDAAAAGRGGLPGVAAVQDSVREVVARIHDRDTLPVFLGGDNSLSFANAAPLVADGSLGVVTLDAHLDCREPVDGPSSGTPYRQLFEAGLDAYVCLGARHFETSTAYAAYVAERGGDVVTAATVGSDTPAALERVRAALDGVEAVYLGLDLDVLDAAAAPGVSAPTPGGLTTRELYSLLRHLAAAERSRLAGFEVVECAPPLDEQGRTVDAAARAVAHFLAGYAAGDGQEVGMDG